MIPIGTLFFCSPTTNKQVILDKERERFSNGVYSAHVKRLLIEGKIHNAG